VRLFRMTTLQAARRDFSPRTGKGGASAPPLQDIRYCCRVSRPAQRVRTSGAGRETHTDSEAASSAGLKPRPSGHLTKTTESGEKSGSDEGHGAKGRAGPPADSEGQSEEEKEVGKLIQIAEVLDD